MTETMTPPAIDTLPFYDAPAASRLELDRPAEHPVFVTPDGRPRRRGPIAATALAALMSAWIAAVVVGGSGFSSVPALTARPLTGHAFPARLHATEASARHALHPRRDHARLRADHALVRAVATQIRPAAS